MDFSLTPLQRDRSRELRERTLALVADGVLGSSGTTLSRSAWAAASDLGMTGLTAPQECGGEGLGALDTALCLESFTAAGVDAGTAFAIAAHLLACAVPLRDFGHAPVHRSLLSRMATGELVAANAMTEDGAGSDVAKLATTIIFDDDHVVVDGAKSYVSNGPIAGVFIVFGTSSPDDGFLGQSAVAVLLDTPGVTVGAPLPKVGLESCPAARVEFSGCRVPVEHVIGRPGQGGVIFQHSMSWERSCLFAIYLGQMQRQLDRCVKHARGRQQFGRPIGSFQAVSHRLATMSQRLQSARLLLYRACWLLDEGVTDSSAIAISKLAVSESSVANSLDAVQIFGGRGLVAGSGIEADLRDAVPSAIFSGTSDIQREIIARDLGL